MTKVVRRRPEDVREESLQLAIKELKESGGWLRKPRIKKVYDDILGKYVWSVPYPPHNNFGCSFVAAESTLAGRAEEWCFATNAKERTDGRQ